GTCQCETKRPRRRRASRWRRHHRGPAPRRTRRGWCCRAEAARHQQRDIARAFLVHPSQMAGAIPTLESYDLRQWHQGARASLRSRGLQVRPRIDARRSHIMTMQVGDKINVLNVVVTALISVAVAGVGWTLQRQSERLAQQTSTIQAMNDVNR